MIATRNAKRQSRAYLSVVPRGMRNLRSTAAMVAYVGIRNAGQTPAHNVTIHLVMVEPPSKEDFNEPSLTAPDPRSQRTIHPDTEIERATSEKVSLPKIERPDRYVFVYGAVGYLDVFGDTHHTHFCHRYNLASFDRDKNERWTIDERTARHSDTGNHAD